MNDQKTLKKIMLECCAKIEDSKKNGHYFSKPFQYCYVDNFLPIQFAEATMEAFPPLGSDCWDSSNDEGIEIKHRTNWQSEFDIPDGILPIIRILNSAPMLKTMGDLFDIPKLLPDPYFSGGGLNRS